MPPDILSGYFHSQRQLPVVDVVTQVKQLCPLGLTNLAEKGEVKTSPPLPNRLLKLVPRPILNWLGWGITSPDDCRSLLKELLRSPDLEARVCQLQGTDAQSMINFIDLVRDLRVTSTTHTKAIVCRFYARRKIISRLVRLNVYAVCFTSLRTLPK